MDGMMACSRAPGVMLGSGEIPVGLADSDTVVPEGATGTSWRALGVTSILLAVYWEKPLQQHHHPRVLSWRCCVVPMLQSRSLVEDPRWA